MNCYSQIPSGIFVDGIKILTRPAENDFSEVIFSNDDIYLRNMRLHKNISVWFDAGVIIKSHNLEYTVRNDAVQIIQTLLKKSIPVYMTGSAMYSFCEIWNNWCCNENIKESIKAVMIPDVIDSWHNINCIGVTNRELTDTQMHFMYEGAGVPVTMVTGTRTVDLNHSTKVTYSASFANVIKVSDEPFELN